MSGGWLDNDRIAISTGAQVCHRRIGMVDAEQIRLAQLGLTTVDERAITYCYVQQDEFRVADTAAANIKRVSDGEQRWDTAQAELVAADWAGNPVLRRPAGRQRR